MAVQARMGGGYNRNAARLIKLAEVQADHGQTGVGALIREFDLETLFGLKPGTTFNEPA